MMPKYKINSDGNVIIAEQNFMDAMYPGNYTLLPDYTVPPSGLRVLSKLVFINRFTDAEMAGIYTAAKSSVQVEIWLEKFKLASEINLDDPRTVAGIQALEAAGLIGAGRAIEILV